MIFQGDKTGASWTVTISIGLLSLMFMVGCGGSKPEKDEPAAQAPAQPPVTTTVNSGEKKLSLDQVPKHMQACYGCHPPIVAEYMDHGMAASLGPVGTIEVGAVTNPLNGNQYRLEKQGDHTFLNTTTGAGGIRRQRVAGRIGAGIFDTSWVTEEYDLFDGTPTGRLYFAPIETIKNHGLELSPFEYHAGSKGADFTLTEQCTTCHTLDRPASLPNASKSDSGVVYPPHAWGGDAFDHLGSIGCDGCHGDSKHHVSIMVGDSGATGLGLTQLNHLSPGEQRDTCARCHLQGEIRLDLVDGDPKRGHPLAGQIPVVVAAEQTDDFRFVGQLERLALSQCFIQSATMTCNSCHDSHKGVAAQGIASFDQACMKCHQEQEAPAPDEVVDPASADPASADPATAEAATDGEVEAETPAPLVTTAALLPKSKPCSRDIALKVEDVIGEAGRTRERCVDCHMSRSQPFDLPHVRSADHFIRRNIPAPKNDIPHRTYTDVDGPLKLFDDGRLAGYLDAEGGALWRDGVMAMAMTAMGRLPEALKLFDRFPEPGTPEARIATAPEGLVPLETRADFHAARGLCLQNSGDLPRAAAAYEDALALDPSLSDTRMARAAIYFGIGNLKGALLDTEAVIHDFPNAEKPWDLRAQMALRIGHTDLAIAALRKSTQNWPSNPAIWQELGNQLLKQGKEDEARDAFQKAKTLAPNRPGLDVLD